MLIARQGDPDFVKVLDFGLAKVVAQALPAGGDKPAQALTKHGSIFGTPKYMAPEQCISGPTDGRTDLYALGLIMYEMLAGVHPFDAKDGLSWIRHQLSTPVPPMKARAPRVTVPAALEALVIRLVSKRPEDRFENASALLSALAEVCEREGIQAPAAAPGASASGSGPRPALSPRDGERAIQTVASVDMVSIGDTDLPALAARSPAGPVAAASTGGPELPRQLAALLARLPAPLRQRPALLLLPVALLGVLLLLVLRSGPAPDVERRTTTSVPAAQPGRALAAQPQLDAAIASGLPALLSLSKEYPADKRVLRAVAHTYMAQRQGAQALRVLARVVKLDDALVPDGELVQATMLALGDQNSVDATFELLENELGARGVDVLYGLHVKPGPLRLKLHYKQSLTRPEVRAHASPACAVALELREAETCEAKLALLGRAEKAGDGRALAYLKTLTQTHNCGPYGMIDCYACLRQGGALQHALTTLEARAAQPPAR